METFTARMCSFSQDNLSFWSYLWLTGFLSAMLLHLIYVFFEFCGGFRDSIYFLVKLKNSLKVIFV